MYYLAAFQVFERQLACLMKSCTIRTQLLVSRPFFYVAQGAAMQPSHPAQLAPDEFTSEEPKEVVDIIKVSARSRSTAVAGAIAGVVREHNRAEVQAIGAGAVNQAVKAVAIARGYLSEDNIDVIVIPFFTEVMIDDQERTAVRMVVEPR
jgi:stage V sporulation protein S